MKKVNVFDTYKIIRDKDGFTNFNEDLLEKLDALLDQVGVDHAFCECRNEEIEDDANVVVTVMYNAEDDEKFFLAYALFIRTFRGANDQMVRAAMIRHLTNER